MKLLLTNLVVWGSYLLFPLLIWIWWLWNKGNLAFGWVLFLTILASLFIYGRWIERYQIQVVEHEYVFSSNKDKELKIAVVGDIHVGNYKNDKYLNRVIDVVLAQGPDVILIPGDFLYGMNPKDLKQYLSPLKRLGDIPTYGVMGNHDLAMGKEHLEDELIQTLTSYGIEIVDGVARPLWGDDIKLVGLTDFWHWDRDESAFQYVNKEDSVILLTHNPDTIHELINIDKVDLVISGHTHGAQFRIPGLVQAVIPTKYPFDYAWSKVKNTDVFITAGIGEVILPFRVGIKPRVDIINLKY